MRMRTARKRRESWHARGDERTKVFQQVSRGCFRSSFGILFSLPGKNELLTTENSPMEVRTMMVGRELAGIWVGLSSNDTSTHPDDFESSPVLPKKAARGEPGTRSAKSSNRTSTLTTAANKVVSETSKKNPTDVRDSGPPPKKARRSRDERQFSKDTEKALRESVAETSLPDVACNHKEDTEYRPAGDEEEEEEYLSGAEDSSDSDFSEAGPPSSKTGRKKKAPAGRGGTSTAVGKTTQKKPVEKKSKKVANKIEVESKKTMSVSTSKPVMSIPTGLVSPSPTLSSSASSPRLGVRKMPKWTPPGPANRENQHTDSNLVKSGGTPVIRVGLSRKARVKPLHNSSHVQTL